MGRAVGHGPLGKLNPSGTQEAFYTITIQVRVWGLSRNLGRGVGGCLPLSLAEL